MAVDKPVGVAVGRARGTGGVRSRHDLRAGAAIAVLLLSTALTGCAGQAWNESGSSDGDAGLRYEQLMRIAHAARRGGNVQSAVQLYERAHSLAPNNAEALIALGDASADLGATDKAAAYFAKATSLSPNDVRVRRGHGKVLLALHAPEEAAEAFRAAIRLDPADIRSHAGLGVALDLAGDHAEAQRVYSEGLTRSSAGDPLLTNNLGLSLALSGRHAEAQHLLTELIAHPDAGPRARQNLALALALSGDASGAARVAREDLPEADAKKALAFYRSLGGLSGRARAQAVFTAQMTGGTASAVDPLAGNAAAPAGRPPTAAAMRGRGGEPVAGDAPPGLSGERLARLEAAAHMAQFAIDGSDETYDDLPEVCLDPLADYAELSADGRGAPVVIGPGGVRGDDPGGELRRPQITARLDATACAGSAAGGGGFGCTVGGQSPGVPLVVRGAVDKPSLEIVIDTPVRRATRAPQPAAPAAAPAGDQPSVTDALGEAVDLVGRFARDIVVATAQRIGDAGAAIAKPAVTIISPVHRGSRAVVVEVVPASGTVVARHAVDIIE